MPTTPTIEISAPFSTWNKKYGNVPAGHELDLAQKNKEQLLSYLNTEVNPANLSLMQRKRLWLIIAYTHPMLEPLDLIELAIPLKISNTEIFCLSAEFGHLEIMNIQNVRMFRNDVTKILEKAIRLNFDNRQGNLIENLLNFISDTDFRKSVFYMVMLKKSIEVGNFALTKYILIKITPFGGEQLQKIIKARGYGLFLTACKCGNVKMMDYIFQNIKPELLQEMIKVVDSDSERYKPYEIDHGVGLNGQYSGFKYAVSSGNSDAINLLLEKCHPNNIQEMIAVDDYQAFHFAASCPNVEVIDSLFAKCDPDKIQTMIESSDYQAFQNAIANGHIAVLRRLFEKCDPEKIQAMIESNLYSAFNQAALNGPIESIDLLLEKCNPARISMLYGYRAFHNAASNKDIAIINRLFERCDPNRMEEMISSNNFEAFYNAALSGNLGIINLLIEKCRPDNIQKMIEAMSCRAFFGALKGGHIEVITRLGEYVSWNKIESLIDKQSYDGEYINSIATNFQDICMKGHPAVINLLFENCDTDRIQALIEKNNYEVFQQAVVDRDLIKIDLLINKCNPEKIQQMIAVNQYHGFRHVIHAANNQEDLNLFQIYSRFLEICDNDKIEQMAGTLDALNFAQAHDHKASINLFLTFPNIFSHAESHLREYYHLVQPFIQIQLAALRLRYEELQRNTPNAVFDIANNNEAQLYFYMVRNLIRINDPTVLDDIIFLLDIPSVKALAHTGGSLVAHRNELLRLAMSTRNQGAIDILMQIQAVREEAARNDYYRTEQSQGIDLAQLAQDRESSMTALTSGEKKRLESVTTCYHEFLKNAGVENVITGLREELESRYEDKPAKVTVNGKELELPLMWEDFKKLNLNGEDEANALKAYYQNKDHSAFRYLLKPNSWMSPAAQHVNLDNNDRTQRWPTFEDYKPLIAILYLAAKDSQTAPIQGHTFETRLTHFIDELALINRAHNWDKTRIKSITKNGQIKEVKEEYDDLDGDRPSCYSGVKRRLFQSVQGHPLLTVLTPDLMNQELNEFIRDHFKHCIESRVVNRKEFQAAADDWESSVIMLEETKPETLALFKKLDISPESQKEFTKSLAEKWKNQFTNESHFTNQINTTFSLSDKGMIYETHLQKFYERVAVKLLLRESTPEEKRVTASSSSTLFAPSSPSESKAVSSSDEIKNPRTHPSS